MSLTSNRVSEKGIVMLLKRELDHPVLAYPQTQVLPLKHLYFDNFFVRDL